MQPNQETQSPSSLVEIHDVAVPQARSSEEPAFRLSRWLVAFASGAEWYPVGEFVAADATSAIDRAINIFGCGAAHSAGEIRAQAGWVERAITTKSEGLTVTFRLTVNGSRAYPLDETQNEIG